MKMRICTALAIACGLAGVPALAQHDAAKPAAQPAKGDKPAAAQPGDPAAETAAWMKSMTCNEHHSHLQAQAGEWDATMKFWMAGPDAPPVESKGKMACTMENNGLILKSEFKGEMMGMPFVGTGYTAYDNNTKKYTGVWMDSTIPGILTHQGDCSADGKVMTMKGDYVDHMGRNVKQRLVSTMVDGNTMKFEMNASMNGGPETKMGEITYTRAKADANKPAEAAKSGGEAKSGGAVAAKELPAGLLIEDQVVGTGEVCPPGAKVTIHYRGTLKDGKEFDSSYSRGQPATFPLPNLIKGWQEGIPGMKVGGKRRLTIPYALAYGEAGRPPVIPPKADLIFDIELLGIAK